MKIFFNVQSNPAISKSQGKWKKKFEIAGFDCICFELNILLRGLGFRIFHVCFYILENISN